LKGFSIYFLANLLSKGVGFFSLIYITHYISPEKYGELSYLLAVSALVVSISMLGLPGLILTDYISKDKIQRYILESKIITYITSVSIVLLIILALFILVNNINDSLVYILLLLYIIGSYFMHIEVNILRMNNQIVKLSSILIVSSILSLILILSFVEQHGIYILLVTISIPGMLFFISYFLNKLKDTEKLKVLYPSKTDFSISIPIMMSSFVMLSYYFIDKQYMLSFLGAQNLAIYEVAFKFGNLYDILIVQVINTIWMPIFYKKMADDERLALSFQIKLSIFTIFAGIIVFAVPNIVWNIPQYFIDESYHEAVKYIKFIIFNAFIFQAITFLNMYFMYKKKTRIMVYALGIVVLINGLVNYFTIQTYGIYGVFVGNVVALLVGYGFMVKSVSYEYSNIKFFN
jgi:O-antigen/teichoic acid export membrane protein